MKKHLLLSIAIFLATIMNGILIYELINQSSAAAEITVNDIVPKTKTVTNIKVRIVEVPTIRRVVYYQRWEYKPCQPTRNVCRFFHNNRPLRRAVCSKSLYLQYWYF